MTPVLLFLGLMAAAVFIRAGDIKEGDLAPAFTAETLSGETLALAELRGKPVVVNFWASWCGPCADEAPLFERAYEEYGDRIAFVGVDIKDARSDAEAFLARYHLDYPHVRDEDLAIYDAYGLTGQPETFFLDEKGLIVKHIPGPVDEELLFRLLDSLVARAA
jgi:cytochrome c biogenesis protein CcmG, thiol:disulfide interchange protein DsbE